MPTHEPTHASFFSGVGGTDLGLERAGWATVSLSEIDPYANAVLAHHWPDVPNLGDIVALAEAEQHEPGAWQRATLWSGGFPCQDLSVAGKRRGFRDEEGNLTRSGLAFAFLTLVERYRPPAILLENVPGLLTSNAGRDFGELAHTLGELGYWWAYRILDAQFFGVPQRRDRVFVLALNAQSGLGPDGPGSVLAVGARCSGHPETIEPSGTGAAGSTSRSSDGASGPDIAGSLSIGGHVGIQPNGQDAWTGQLVVGRSGHQHYREGFGNLTARDYKDQSHLVVGPGTPDHPGGGGEADGLAGRLDDSPELAPTLTAPDTRRHDDADGKRQDGSRTDRIPIVLSHALRVGPANIRSGGPSDTVPIIAATLNSGGNDGGFRTEPGEHLVYVKRGRAQTADDAESWGEGDVMPTLNAFDGGDVRTTSAIIGGSVEDDPMLPDGLDSHRYRCCGNGVVAPVAEWIGTRLLAALKEQP